MLRITSREIREIFLKYFEGKDHLRISGSSIIPSNDPTLLFINSGMAPLKKYFTGEAQPPKSDLCNIQPCIRTIDIDEIGDRHHLTSFEMLGSWSINNYFKEGAITLAYNLLIEGLKIPKDKIYVTVFAGYPELNLEPDDESAKIWERVGLDKSHIVYQPIEDNFWGPTAETGPCGPCTEVFYDTGDEFGAPYVEGGHFDTKSRYIEIWNAGVFMQFNKNSDGTYDNLKFKSVDTGAGLERLTMALNGLSSVYETDLLKPILDEVALQAKGKDTLTPRAMRVITDHMRTTTFILSEGIKPSNDGRGYIPRRLIRKCAVFALKAKIDDFDFVPVLNKVIGQYGDFYTHFKEKKAEIIETFEKERSQFQQVLKDGFKRMEKLMDKANFEVSGKDAFELVSTYGIPFDLIKEFALEKGGKVNEEDFKKEFEKHQEISRSSASGDNTDSQKLSLSKYKEVLSGFGETEFTGYDTCSSQAKVLGLIKDDKMVKSASAGDMVLIIGDKTSFYAESGGQIADTGKVLAGSSVIDIIDVQKNDNKTYVHLGVVKSGEISEGAEVTMKVDEARRARIKANHSSVHLLQSALRKTLGDSIKQAGSLVEEERLRFDFSYDTKISDEQLESIERQVNELVQMDIPLTTEVTSLNEAMKKGVLAFFEDKYGDSVRVIMFGDASKELCGGTHIESTGKIGYVKILSEGSVGRGTRRITAITGNRAVEYVQSQLRILKEVALKLKASPEDVVAKLNTFAQAPKVQKITGFAPMKKEEVESKIKKTQKSRSYIIKEFSEFSNEIRDEAIRISEMIHGVVCFICKEEDKVKVIVSVDKPLTKEMNSNMILQKALKYFDGKGGGQPHLALGGGTKTAQSDKITNDFADIIDSI